MGKLYDNLIVIRRQLIVNEDDIMGLLRIFDRVNHRFRNDVLMDMEIGRCGWADDPNKWYIHFGTSNRKWRSIIMEIKNNHRMLILKEDNRLYLI